jgi:hypothetical protein
LLPTLELVPAGQTEAFEDLIFFHWDDRPVYRQNPWEMMKKVWFNFASYTAAEANQ